MKNFVRISVALLGLMAVVGSLGAVKALQIKKMIAHGESFVPPPQTVSVASVQRAAWEETIEAVGTLEAVRGVVTMAELPGKVARIAFDSGANVTAGQLLVQQDISVETAQLKVARSERDLAEKDLDRVQTLFEKKAVPKARLDELQSQLEQAKAREALIGATIAKKTIRAPFTGRLGIRKVNLGEVLASGQPIVTIQSLDPIYVNFQVPQQDLSHLQENLIVRVRSNALGDRVLEGKISAIDPEVDSVTRNVEIQATLPNQHERLRPGMYATLAVVMPEKKRVLTVPTTAIHFAPYSDSVFLVEESGEDNGEAQLVLRQQFVQLGERRGDFVVVRRGLNHGQQVVSTGVFKLRNGQTVVVDNSKSPAFEMTPKPKDA